MNEILKKRIEGAAVEYAESIPQSDERKKYSREHFIAGAKYAISHQWISADEVLPEYDEAIIARNYNGEIFFCHRSNRIGVETDDDKWCNYTGAKIILWMPTPEFETKK